LQLSGSAVQRLGLFLTELLSSRAAELPVLVFFLDFKGFYHYNG